MCATLRPELPNRFLATQTAVADSAVCRVYRAVSERDACNFPSLNDRFQDLISALEKSPV